MQKREMSILLNALRRAWGSWPPVAQETNFWEALEKPLERRRVPRHALNTVVGV